ncbi:tetratricopeptide repeat protein [Tumebacillus sp. BK434]|nr:tetratricopeptide repeat protein [Tumebacillus sp. BK434]
MLESMITIRTAQELVQELNKLELLVENDSDTVLELIGDQLTAWESIVRLHADYSLALRIGKLLEKLRQHWLALSWFHWVSQAEGEAEQDLVLTALRMKGRMYIKVGMYNEALSFLLSVEQQGQSSNRPQGRDLAILWQNIALVYEYLGRYDSAVEYAGRALQWFADYGEEHDVALMEMLLGICYKEQKRFDEAYEYLTRARGGFEKHKDYLHLARTWHNYAELMRDLGRMEEAIAAWRMSLEMKKRIQDFSGQATTLHSIAKYLISENDWYAAMNYITQAIAICHQYRLQDKEVVCLESWAQILFALGRYDELEVCASRATFLAGSDDTQHKVVSLLQKIANDCERVGLEELAKQYSQNAVQLIG